MNSVQIKPLVMQKWNELKETNPEELKIYHDQAKFERLRYISQMKQLKDHGHWYDYTL